MCGGYGASILGYIDHIYFFFSPLNYNVDCKLLGGFMFTFRIQRWEYCFLCSILSVNIYSLEVSYMAEIVK